MFNLATIEKQNPWSLTSRYSSHVDFCIWTMLVDGLQVSPFTQHSSGNQALQQVGLDARGWNEWLRLVVATQDNRLLWHVPDITAKVEKELSKSIAMREQYWSHLTQSRQQTDAILTPTFDIPRERSQTNKYLQWQEQQYQEAAALVGSFSTATLPAMCSGEPIVQQRLESLWQEFIAIPKDTSDIDEVSLTELYQDLHQLFGSRLPVLRIYIVQYPTPVFFPVSPVSILVSQVTNLSIKDLRTGIFRAAECLATSGE